MRLALLVLVGCYEPPTTCGIACTDACPSGFTCQAGVCVGARGECAPAEYTFAQISVGARHACGIDARGHLACWGDNRDRQVGADASELEAFLPQPVAGSWAKVAAGGAHTCAIDDHGALWCWGGGAGPHAVALPADAPAFSEIAVDAFAACAIGAGELWCDGARVDDATSWTQISVGADHACGIAGDTVRCFGTGPVALPGRPIAIEAGDHASCAIVVPGTLWCWDDHTAPAALGDGWSRIDLGGAARCGIRGGHAVCWGDDADIGALGDGAWTGTRDLAHAIDLGPADDVGVSSADAGELQAFGCVRRGDAVECWGDDASAQLGTGAAALRREPIEVPSPTGAQWAHIAAGGEHVCATTDARALYCWGRDTDGDHARPQHAPGAIDRVTDVVVGDGYACTREGDAITCWGDPAKLGAPGGGVVSVPPPGAQWIGLLGGEQATCGVTAPGELACWGDVAGVATPTPTALPTTGLDAIAFGDQFACAHRSDGARVCWGANGAGQLGDGTMIDQPTPTAFDIGGFRDVSARARRACGIATDRSIACWGDNTDGAAGQPNDPFVVQPTSVAGLTSCTQVALGVSHACAVCAGRTLCWGDNARGALGRGDTDRSGGAIPAPISVAGILVEIALARRSGCALDDAHHLWCWGDGRHGELGNGGQAQNVPTPLGARP